MIVILAEKADVGAKIAAALDKITLASGRVITFKTLGANEKAVKAQQSKDGYLKINFKGKECYVTWGRGHLCELKQAKDYNPAYARWSVIPLPLIPEKYEIQMRTARDEKEAKKVKFQFDTVKRLLNKAELVINATDCDREGEVIFSYIYELAGCSKPVKRAVFSSQTQASFKDAFNSLHDPSEFKLIDEAGRMRGIADWLVGSNLTASMTLKFPGQGVISTGRVQTPTLNMCVERELAIRDFKSTPYWTLDAVFTTRAGEHYKAKYHIDKIPNRTDAETLFKKVNGHSGIVTDIEVKTAYRDAPLLYSLSALQMDANSKFGLTLSQTLEIAQKLYDSGYTTYPRTSSQYLTEDMEPTVNAVLDALCVVPDYAALINGRPRKFNRSKYFDNSKVESHYAIIPTDNPATGLTGNEAKVYDLICRSVIKMLYGPAKIEQTKVTTEVESEQFVSSGSTIQDPGWMVVGDSSKEEFLPKLHKGENVSGKYTLNEKKTEPPKRYNDRTLVAAMTTAGKTLDDEDLSKILCDPKVEGIGTEATRANIVETLVNNGYITRKGKSIYATEKGIDFISKLPVEIIKSAELTARWEQRLNNIARGTEISSVFLRDIEKAVAEWVAEINAKVAKAPAASAYGAKSLGVNCPLCGKPMVIQKWGYGCSGWKDGCKFSVGTICKKTLTENQAKMLISKGKSPLIRGFTSKSGKPFDAYLVLDGTNIKFEFPSK